MLMRTIQTVSRSVQQNTTISVKTSSIRYLRILAADPVDSSCAQVG